MSQILDDIEKLIFPVLSEGQVELVDMTYQRTQGGWVLCIYIDKQGGVTLDDCAFWSEKISSKLDEADIIPHAYSLEVSSPGVQRPIKKASDFQRFKGERIFVKMFAPVEGQKAFRGVLLEGDDEKIRIQREGDGTVWNLPRSGVAKAHLDPIIDI